MSPKAQTSTQRWCFAHDDSGHAYLIRAEDSELFDRLAYTADWEVFVARFGDFRCKSPPHSYTFTDPKED
jgi:hypothetical protein